MIKKVTVQGFRNIHKKTMTFEPGVRLIKGKNGIGKTSMIEAIRWCLFGDNLKGENQANLVMRKEYRKRDFKGTASIVHFDKGNDQYVFVRAIKHSDFKTGLYVICNGQDLGYTRIEDAQAKINEVLGVSSNTFIYSILFGQRMQRLMDAKEADKRQVFEELFESNFDEYREKAKALRDDAGSEIQKLESEVREINTEVQILSERRKTLDQFVKEFNVKKAAKINELNDKLTNLAPPKEVQHPGSIATNTPQFNLEKPDRPAKVSEPEKENIKTHCDSCGRKHTKKSIEKAEKIANEKYNQRLEIYKQYLKDYEAYEKKLQEYESALEKHKKQVEKDSQVLEDYHRKLREFDRYEIELKNYNDRKQEIVNELKAIKDTSPEKYEKELTDVVNKLIKLADKGEKILGEFNRFKNDFDGYNYWYLKGFSKDGLPAYVFDANLLQAQSLISRYAEFFDYGIEISVGLEGKRKKFEIKVIKEDGVEMPYSSLSGGQKCRVDLCMAFGMNEFLSRSNNFGVMFFDEFLDGLDEEGLYLVFELLQELGKEKSINIVTHTDQFSGMGAREYDFSS